MTESQYFAALAHLPRLTPLRFGKLLKAFDNSAERIWQASAAELAAAGLDRQVAEEVTAARSALDPAEISESLARLGVTVLPITDPAYPELLRQIYAPPVVLFVRGEFPTERDEVSVAVVGSRVLTPYGKQATTELARELARAGVCVVSGLALGADGLAHQAALDSGGRTVAVLGCGIDQVYPPSHRRLADQILASGGALLSEYIPGTEPTAYNFPQRNRIIAGLARGVLVTEGREKSGSLITAQLALEMGREVFAVPGSIFAENSAGPLRLVQAGAKPVLGAADILESLQLGQLPAPETAKLPLGTPTEQQVLAALTREPQSVDALARASGLPSAEVLATLTLLEVRGVAENLGGSQWVRR